MYDSDGALYAIFPLARMASGVGPFATGICGGCREERAGFSLLPDGAYRIF